MEMLSVQAIQDAGLDDWRKLAQALHARFRTGSFAEGARFATAIAETGQTPEVRIGDSFVEFRLVSGSDVTQADVDLARRVSSIAQSLGFTPDPSAVAQLELAIDTANVGEIGPFWAAVLTGDAAAFKGGDVCDPTGRVANLWFQGTEPHEVPKQRFHLDLWIAPEAVRPRIEAALAVGGTITYDAEAPAFTVLADPQGNKVCLCTFLDR
jgi:4a-hydroxytetrahydrobiopterin dehydratase